jgi:hypothetical protein
MRPSSKRSRSWPPVRERGIDTGSVWPPVRETSDDGAPVDKRSRRETVVQSAPVSSSSSSNQPMPATSSSDHVARHNQDCSIIRIIMCYGRVSKCCIGGILHY